MMARGGGADGAAPAPAPAPAPSKKEEEEEPWRLYYWPGIKGRGEYVRLAFEEAGVPYVDVAAEAADPKEGYRLIKEACFATTAVTAAAAAAAPPSDHFPVRAPPAIARGDFWLCNTPAILSFLNTEFGWDPPAPTEGARARARAHVLSALEVVLSDAVAEGRLPFHARAWYGSHALPENAAPETCAPYLEEYGTRRLPKYLDFLEAALAHSGGADNNGGGPFLVGGGLTTADLAAWHYLCALERHYAPHYGREIAARPLLRAFKARVAARPRIAAYLASGRSPPWDADSLM